MMIGSRVADPDATVRSPHRRVSPPLFGIILLCFLLPFVTVDCGKAVTYTGLHAATGIDAPNEYPDHPTPNGWTLLAFSSAGMGVLLGLLRGRKGALGGALAGFAGIVWLVGFIVYVAGASHGRFAPRIGYALSLFLLLGAVVLNDHLLTRPRAPTPAGEHAFRTRTRRYVTAMGLVAASLLVTLLGSIGSPGGGSGNYEMKWYAWFFFSGLLLATCTGLGALTHAFAHRGREGYE
jgi:hypothetical protein